MDRMAEVVPDSKSRNLQQFITHSKWNAREVIDHVAKDTDQLLGDNPKAGLIIDETGFAKQGRMSVGVARQWLGRLGKVDNGQVAVFGVLANDRFVNPIDTRLYLPRSWTEDSERCDRACIPESERTFRTKDELAVEIVLHARRNGIRFSWVGTDAGYGKGPGFMRMLEKIGEQFMVDVHSDFSVYLEDPQPYIPAKTNSRGRAPKRYQTDATSFEVQEIVKRAKLDDQPILKLRQTTRGPLEAHALRLPVYIWDGESENVEKRWLVASQLTDGSPDTKISLSNAPEGIDLQTLVWRQRQRYWVERAFEDAKSECGMADYQVRKWPAWHHHMALVMMTTLFMLTERINHEDSYPLLSCADIEELLSHFLPRRDVTKAEIIKQLEDRHRKRQAAIESHTRNSEQNKGPRTGVD